MLLAAMSLFSVQARKHTAYYDHLMSIPSSRTPARVRPPDRKSTDSTSGDSACEDSRISGKSRQINRTYVISALSKGGPGQQTPQRNRLTLQRRSRKKSGIESVDKTMAECSQNITPAEEKRLTLQRRTRTPSMDKSVQGQREAQPTSQVLIEANGRSPALFRSSSLRETSTQKKIPLKTHDKLALNKTPTSTVSQLEDQAQTFKTPTKKTPFEKIAAKRDVFEKLAAKETPKLVKVKSASLERPKPKVQQSQESKPAPTPRITKVASGVRKPSTELQVTRTSGPKESVTQTRISPPAATAKTAKLSEQRQSGSTEAVKQQDSFKMENSAVTVAVRVRPFSSR